MANFPIHSPLDFTEELRMLETSDPNHANTWNALYEKLINNDLYLKALAGRQFYLKLAAYDEANNEIDLTFSPGAAELFNGSTRALVEKAAESNYSIPTPAVETTYYIYIQADGTFTHNTTGVIPAGAALLWQVTTGAAVSTITKTDRRAMISSAAEALDKHLDNGAYHSQSMARQAVIDGNFQIAQVNPSTGTPITDPASGTYPVFDLWKLSYASDGGVLPTIQHSQVFTGVGALLGSDYCYRVNVDGAGSGFGANALYNILHYIEQGTALLCGLNKKVTLSFCARSTIEGKKLGFYINQLYGTAGSGEESLFGDHVDLTSDWQEFSHTFDTNTLVGKTLNTTDNRLLLIFCLQWGSGRIELFNASAAETFVGAGNIEIARVQLCAGDIALPFAPKSFAEELRACQRYFEKSYNYHTMPGQNEAGGCAVAQTLDNAASNRFKVITGAQYAVPKRTTPTLSLWDYAGTSGNMCKYNSSSTKLAIANSNFTPKNRRELCHYIEIVSNGEAGATYLFQWVADARF